MNDFELQKLYDWIKDKDREPAQTKFSAGIIRDIAKKFEFILHKTVDNSSVCPDCGENDPNKINKLLTTAECKRCYHIWRIC